MSQYIFDLANHFPLSFFDTRASMMFFENMGHGSALSVCIADPFA